MNEKNQKGNNESGANQNPSPIIRNSSKASEYVYFIESEVIELHSEEMFANMIAEKLWENIEKTLDTTLFNQK